MGMRMYFAFVATEGCIYLAPTWGDKDEMVRSGKPGHAIIGLRGA